MPQEIFEFKFMLTQTSVIIDETTVTLKLPLTSKSVELAKLKYLYVLTHPDVGQECVLAYEGPSRKLKRLRIESNFEEAGFKAMVERLVALKPEIDIRDKSLKEAQRLMGAANLVRLMPGVVFLLGTIIITLMFLPSLAHVFDQGQTVYDARLCRASCNLSSRNVLLSNGYLYTESYLELTSTSRGSSSISYYFAYLPDDWKEGEPIYNIVKTEQVSDEEISKLESQTEIPAVLRNALWEGLSSDVRDFFEKELGFRVAAEARLFEYGADIQAEIIFYFIVEGLLLIITVIVGIIVKRSYAKKK